MRILKTAPENREFFNEHGESLSKYQLIGFIGQCLSGAALAYAVFALIVSQTAGQIPPTLTTTIALIVGLFVELANRVLARPAIKPFVVKDTFADAPDLQSRHVILNRSYLVGLVFVALLSYVLSAVGSTYYADDASGTPALVNEDSLKQVAALAVANLNGQFVADTAMTAQPYNIRLQAEKERFKADSSKLMKERSRYKGCANDGNKYCKGKLTAFLGKIDERRAVLADSTASIATQKAAALAVILADRKQSFEQLDKAAQNELNRARDTNTTTTAEHEAETNFQGLIFIILTVAGQTVFYFMVYLTLQVEAGAEITYTLEPNEFWNLPGTTAEFFTGLSWRTERKARAVLRKLYTPRKERKTDIPYKGLFDNASGNNSTQAAHTQRTAEQRNGKACKPRARTQDVTQQQTQHEPQTERQRKTGEVGSIEQCDHCGNDYTRKTTRQRFCSTDCRLNHHATKHNGKRFDTILNGQK